MEISNTHPYMVCMDKWVPYHCNQLLNQRQITPQEFQNISNIFASTKSNFVQAVLTNYPQGVDENTLQSLILNKYIASMITRMRSMNTGNSMFQNNTNMFGGGMNMNMNGGWPQQNNGMFSGNMMQGNGSSIFGSGQPQQPAPMPVAQPQQQTNKPKAQILQSTAKKAWAEPHLEEGVVNKTFANSTGDVAFKASNFLRSNGERITEVFCIDTQIRHLGKDEIIESIKRLPGVLANQYFVTCVHYEPLVINASMDDMINLSLKFGKEFSSELGMLHTGHGVSNITPLNTILDKYPQGLSREFSQMLINEFNYHMGAGELVDTKHPEDYLGIGKLDDINTIALGDFTDPNLKAIPGEVEGFADRLNLIIEKSVVAIINKLKTYIVDPKADANLLDVFNRVIPRYYTVDGTNFIPTENLVALYMLTKEHVGTSQTPRAIKAKEKYDATLKDLLNRFTVMLLPRVTSFTTLDPGEAMAYSGNDVLPKCFLEPVNDMSFFLFRALTYIAKGSSISAKQAPCFLRTINSEAITDLMYGATTDDGLWTGVDPQLYL